jgi:ribonuclease HII
MALIKEGGARGELEKIFSARGEKNIVGVDEAGRGPCAGPLVAAAVMLTDIFDPAHIQINDSKKLTSKKREELYEYVIDSAAAYSIIEIPSEEIDKFGLHLMNKQAMINAVSSLDKPIDLVLTDGYFLPEMPVKSHGVWKGDSACISIAAASILAKVTRDRIMEEFDEIYPVYGFKDHKGYSAASHMEAIKKYGVLPIHRRSFSNIAKIIEEMPQDS